MRVLFSTTAGSGHFGPMVPFAQACRDAGHEVKVAAPASFAAAVNGAGLDHAPFADVPPEVMGPIYQSLFTATREEANQTVVADIFGRLDAQAALPGMTAILADWRPDVVLREFCEFGSLVAACAAGIPQVEVAIGVAATVADSLPIVVEPLAELDAIAGLPEGTAYQALISAPVLSCIPAEIDGQDDAGAARVTRFQDPSFLAEPASPPAWGDPNHPLVYVTFGSVAAGLPPFAGVYRAALDALAGEPLRVLVTTGRGIEPGSLGPVPANARVEQWWPQGSVMSHTAVAVGHGGFGTTMTALAAGVPQVIVPLFASDQFINAERVAAIGAGVCLHGGPAAIPSLAAAGAGVLGDPAYREKAQVLAADMASLPPIASSVSSLEALAKG
jgi:UDP:flavonoid glycosyltransferase YjiC (YdhE family)